MSDWKLSCVGRVERVEREELDKSGAQERAKLYIVLAIEECTVGSPDASVGEQLTFGVSVAQLRALTMRVPREGERVSVEGLATGVRPEHARLTAITFHERPIPLF